MGNERKENKLISKCIYWSVEKQLNSSLDGRVMLCSWHGFRLLTSETSVSIEGPRLCERAGADLCEVLLYVLSVWD